MPSLDLAALRVQIKSRKLGTLYLLTGDDVKLIDRLVDAIEGTVDPADQPFAVERLYAGDQGGSPLDIAAAARVYPMLGDRRIVFVLRGERLLKPKRASKTADLETPEADASAEEAAVDLVPLEEYVASPVPTTTLVFIAAEIDRTRRFVKRLLDKAHVVVVGDLGGASGGRPDSGAAAAALVNAELAHEGRTIDPAALRLLVERSGEDVTTLRGSLERLLLYTAGRPRISAADVEEVASFGQAPVDDWALVNAIGDGDPGRALREVAARLDRGDSPHAVLGQLRWWVSTRLAESAPGRVAPALDALLRTDLALKSSGADSRVLLERLVVDLTGSPVSRGWR